MAKFRIWSGIERYHAGAGHYWISQKDKIVEAKDSHEILSNQEKFAGKGRAIIQLEKVVE